MQNLKRLCRKSRISLHFIFSCTSCKISKGYGVRFLIVSFITFLYFSWKISSLQSSDRRCISMRKELSGPRERIGRNHEKKRRGKQDHPEAGERSHQSRELFRNITIWEEACWSDDKRDADQYKKPTNIIRSAVRTLSWNSQKTRAIFLIDRNKVARFLLRVSLFL